MSETEPEIPEIVEPDRRKEETEKPQFKIESLEDMRKIMIIAKGGDPDAIQAITNFMDFKSNAERAYFPNKKITLCVGQLMGYGKAHFPNEDWDPFTLVADAITIPFMGYKGFKSNQFVEITRQTPNLDALTSSPDNVKQGVIAKMLGRGKTE